MALNIRLYEAQKNSANLLTLSRRKFEILNLATSELEVVFDEEIAVNGGHLLLEVECLNIGASIDQPKIIIYGSSEELTADERSWEICQITAGKELLKIDEFGMIRGRLGFIPNNSIFIKNFDSSANISFSFKYLTVAPEEIIP